MPLPQSQTHRQNEPVFEKIRAFTGETLWVQQRPNGLWRIANIPVSTCNLRYNALVRLKHGSDGIREIESVENVGGYARALVLTTESGDLPKGILPCLSAITPCEGFDESRIVFTVNRRSWKAVKALAKTHNLRMRVFRSVDGVQPFSWAS